MYESFEADSSEDELSSSSPNPVVPLGQEQEARKGMSLSPSLEKIPTRPSWLAPPWTIMLSVIIVKLMVTGNIPCGVRPSITNIIKSGDLFFTGLNTTMQELLYALSHTRMDLVSEGKTTVIW